MEYEILEKLIYGIKKPHLYLKINVDSNIEKIEIHIDKNVKIIDTSKNENEILIDMDSLISLNSQKRQWWIRVLSVVERLSTCSNSVKFVVLVSQRIKQSLL